MRNYKNIIKVLSVILGTMIGAGFASGKEIYNFFVKYGLTGIIGIIISGILTGIIIYCTLKICNNRKIKNNKELINDIKGPQFLYNIVNIFLIISFYIMITGFSSFFKQEFNISTYITSAILCIFMYFVLSNKVEGIIKVNVFLVPVLILSMLYISFKYANFTEIYKLKNNNIISCMGSAVLYASYNSITLIPILITLKQYVENKKDNIIISVLSSFFIIVLAIGIYGLLLSRNVNIENIELPVIILLKNKTEKVLYSIAIEAAILTSAISAGYVVLENKKEKTKEDKKRYKKIVAIMCLLGIPISAIGFGNLIKTLYPIFGVLGLAQIILILKNSVAKI